MPKYLIYTTFKGITLCNVKNGVRQINNSIYTNDISGDDLIFAPYTSALFIIIIFYIILVIRNRIKNKWHPKENDRTTAPCREGSASSLGNLAATSLIPCHEFDVVNGLALRPKNTGYLAQTENRQRRDHRPLVHSVTSCDRSLRLGSLCRLIASDTILRYTSLMSDSMHISSIRQSALGFHIHVKTSASQACPLFVSLLRNKVGSACCGRCTQWLRKEKYLHRKTILHRAGLRYEWI